MNPEIFREYDIRGVVESDFPDDVLIQLGKGFGTYLQQQGGRKATLGRDVRLSSTHMRDCLLEGILSTGVEVVDLGEVPTPVSYFSLFQLNVDGGLMITGSHNPPEYNGLKVEIGRTTIYGEEIQRFRALIEQKNFKSGKGTVTEYDILPEYLEAVAKRITLARPVRAVFDSGNGTGGLVAPQLMERIGCEAQHLYAEPDGRFPNHHPDPTVEANVRDLAKKVVSDGAEVGIGFDGDADRIGAVDEKGRIIRGDQLLALFARGLLEKESGHKIIFDVKCSQALVEYITTYGGEPVMWKTGHSLIKNKMHEIKSPLSGEMSGHIFFGDNYFGYDDALFAACRLLEIVSKLKEPLSRLVDSIPHYYSTPEIRLETTESEKWDIVKTVKAFFKDDYQTIDIDGVRVVFPDGWGLVRASNTQPVIVVRFEAKTEDRLQEIQALVMEQIRLAGTVKE